MKNIVIGESLVTNPQDLETLVSAVLTKSLRAKKVDLQADGDIRFWGVDVTQSVILQRLNQFGEKLFTQQNGTPPAWSFIMVNYIDPQKCPGGSGDGWHRDSLKPQYKAITYLTAVDQPAQGAFCFIPASNSIGFRLVSAIHRVLSGRNRYSDHAINQTLRAGFAAVPVLLNAGIPFFVNTSLIHRGLPISQGYRIAATVYMAKATDDVGEYATYNTGSPQTVLRQSTH